VKILKKQSNYHKRSFHLHIAIAPTKNIERIEWFAEKATEIGIDEITPVICRFSERKIIKHDRMEKILDKEELKKL
jgi:16S rRNA (uracil1498-N3)-methyltransferase